MATDLSYAQKLGRGEKEITRVKAAASPDLTSIARTLGISEVEALPILDEVANVPATMVAPVATGGAGQASIAFTAPATGGSPITGYEITPSTGGSVFLSTADLTTPIVITGLTAGAGRTFTIKAVNDIGKSAASPASNAVTIT